MHYIACWWFLSLSRSRPRPLIAIGVVTFLCGSVSCAFMLLQCVREDEMNKNEKFEQKVELSFALHVYLIGVIREFLFPFTFPFFWFSAFLSLSHTHALTHLISHLSIYSRVIFHAEFNLRLLNWSTLEAFTTNTPSPSHTHTSI